MYQVCCDEGSIKCRREKSKRNRISSCVVSRNKMRRIIGRLGTRPCFCPVFALPKVPPPKSYTKMCCSSSSSSASWFALCCCFRSIPYAIAGRRGEDRREGVRIEDGENNKYSPWVFVSYYVDVPAAVGSFKILSMLKPAIIPASRVACRCASVKYAGTVTTARLIAVPKYRSASSFNFANTNADNSSGAYTIFLWVSVLMLDDCCITTYGRSSSSPFTISYGWYGLERKVRTIAKKKTRKKRENRMRELGFSPDVRVPTN